jgi:hypothetical protein
MSATWTLLTSLTRQNSHLYFDHSTPDDQGDVPVYVTRLLLISIPYTIARLCEEACARKKAAGLTSGVLAEVDSLMVMIKARKARRILAAVSHSRYEVLDAQSI